MLRYNKIGAENLTSELTQPPSVRMIMSNLGQCKSSKWSQENHRYCQNNDFNTHESLALRNMWLNPKMLIESCYINKHQYYY